MVREGLFREVSLREFPGALVVRIRTLSAMAQVQSSVQELRSCLLHSTEKERGDFEAKALRNGRKPA